jgi:hypothetical protein
VGGSHNTEQRNAFSNTPFFVSTLPASDCKFSAAQESKMSSNPVPDQAHLGSPRCDLDWTGSVYGASERFGSHTSFARTACGDRFCKATTPSILDSHGSRPDSQVTASHRSNKSPRPPTEASYNEDRPSTPTGTAVPNGNQKPRVFQRHGIPIFAELNEKYPPLQSR